MAASPPTAYAALDKGVFPSEAVRYPDPSTEFLVTRLTDPSHTSWLPAFYGRAVSRKSNFLLYSSDRNGTFQAYRLDLRTGQSKILTDAMHLDPASVALMPDEKGCCYVADGAVKYASFASGRDRELYRVPSGFESGSGFCISEDGLYGFLVEKRQGKWRLQSLSLGRGGVATVVEGSEEISNPITRPGRAGLLYRIGDQLHVVNFDGAQNQRLRIAAGGLGPAFWSADGKSVAYLNLPEDRSKLNSVREYTADANEDHLVSTTSQFVHFGRNADSSVFVGASGSKASPYLLLLVRSVKRELTLCEHKASDPRMVAPVFSPNSQRVFFQTDRHGKPAIYSMIVDKLVEATE